MNPSKMRKLRELVSTAKDLSEALTFFFDHFGDRPSFHEKGELMGETPVLASLLEMSTQPLFGKKPEIRNLRMILLEEHNLAHGACQLEGRMAMIIYLTDLRVGMVSMGDIITGTTKMLRFSHSSLAPPGEKEPKIDDPNDHLRDAEPIIVPPSSDKVS